VRLKAGGVKSLLAPLDKAASVAEANRALESSGDAILAWLDPVLKSEAKVSGFKPDAWPFVSYLIAREAHHRRQILLLARQVGVPVDQETSFGLWKRGTRRVPLGIGFEPSINRVRQITR